MISDLLVPNYAYFIMDHVIFSTNINTTQVENETGGRYRNYNSPIVFVTEVPTFEPKIIGMVFLTGAPAETNATIIVALISSVVSFVNKISVRINADRK